MDDDLLAMRKASRRRLKTGCAACELEGEMTPEHLEVFHESYRTTGITAPGRRWWVEQHYPGARVLTLQQPNQCLRLHEAHIDE